MNDEYETRNTHKMIRTSYVRAREREIEIQTKYKNELHKNATRE